MICRAAAAVRGLAVSVRPGQVGGNLVAHPALRGGERKRQRGQQPVMQATRHGAQQRRAQQGPLTLRGELRQLLGQQLVKLQPLPGRVAAVVQRGHRLAGRRVVQALQGVTQRGQAGRHAAGRQQLVQRGALQGGSHGFAQIGLRQLRAGRVDGGQRGGEWGVGVHRPELRMHHLAAKKAAAGLTAHPHPGAHGQGFLVAGVEVEKAQQQAVAVVGDAHQQLAPAAQVDLAILHDALDLHRLAVGAVGNRRDPGFVLVAQRQVQRQIDVAPQAQFVQRPLRAGLLPLGRAGCGRGDGHAARFCRAGGRGVTGGAWVVRGWRVGGAWQAGR